MAYSPVFHYKGERFVYSLSIFVIHLFKIEQTVNNGFLLHDVETKIIIHT